MLDNAALTWLNDWNLDALMAGERPVVAGAVALGLSSLAAFFSWLKGHRTVPLFTWTASIVAILMLLFDVPTIEEFLPALGEWMAANEDVILLSVGIAVLVGGIGSFLGAVRLARPSSWWAQRRYDSDKYEAAVERHGWSKIKAR
ncbi:MAG: hypothetical protein U9N56_09820 [Actinomycetota bacterium]|nr:hypothetical protein [Actinomycetota bacterium]